jgi:molecular chaperone GrpE (heat shock protein)
MYESEESEESEDSESEDSEAEESEESESESESEVEESEESESEESEESESELEESEAEETEAIKDESTDIKPYPIIKNDIHIVELYISNFEEISNKLPKNKIGYFDPVFVIAMTQTAIDLTMAFYSQTTVVHQNEMVLIFNKDIVDTNRDKHISEISSYVTAKFYRNIINILDNLDKNVRQKYDSMANMVDEFKIIFNSKIISLNKNELEDYLYCKSEVDFYPKCVNVYFGSKITKTIKSLDVNEKVELLKEKYNIDINDIDMNLRYGLYIKRANININRPKIFMFAIKIQNWHNLTDIILAEKITDHINELESNPLNFVMVDSDI